MNLVFPLYSIGSVNKTIYPSVNKTQNSDESAIIKLSLSGWKHRAFSCFNITAKSTSWYNDHIFTLYYKYYHMSNKTDISLGSSCDGDDLYWKWSIPDGYELLTVESFFRSAVNIFRLLILRMIANYKLCHTQSKMISLPCDLSDNKCSFRNYLLIFFGVGSSPWHRIVGVKY